MFWILLTILLVTINAIPSQIGFYSGHKVIEVDNTPQISLLLRNMAADIFTQNQRTINVRLTPDQFTQFTSLIPSNINFRIKVNDLQQVLNSADELQRSFVGDWFEAYHSYDEILKWFTKHAKDNPGAVKMVPSIGLTHQNRSIFAVHLTNPRNDGKLKKQVWFQSLIHAREWITGTTTQYIFHHLLTNRNIDPIVKQALNDVEVIFIPIFNPDGYEYSRTHRMWRKNCRLDPGSPLGVDLNRNFPQHWGGGGASTNPAADDYRGPGPASEPETQAIINYFNLQPNIVGTVDWHSFSQLILRPYSDGSDDAPDDEKLKLLGEIMTDDIKSYRGTEYKNKKSFELYIHSGTSVDFFYGDGGKVYSYTLELSPGNDSTQGVGFILPPSEIISVGKDLVPAAIRFIRYTADNQLSRK